MAKQFTKLSTPHQHFIKAQKIFFVSTAACDGRVNLSPKGLDSFRIIDANRIIWLNLTGSGNETAAHLLKNDRMTIMFCSFEGPPLILRLYGTAKVYHQRDEGYQQFIGQFPDDNGARQIFDMQVDMVQTSCGYAVPLMEFQEERSRLTKWSADKGKDGIEEYWKEKNIESLDGFPTGLIDPVA